MSEIGDATTPARAMRALSLGGREVTTQKNLAGPAKDNSIARRGAASSYRIDTAGDGIAGPFHCASPPGGPSTRAGAGTSTLSGRPQAASKALAMAAAVLPAAAASPMTATEAPGWARRAMAAPVGRRAQ